MEVNRPLWTRSGRSPVDLTQLLGGFGYALLRAQHDLLQRNDWAVEDFVFVAPASRALIGF